MYIAAVTPSDVSIRFVDERFERVDFTKPVDLVGISVVTRAAHRAYSISEEYRRLGAKVVLGGIHPSVMQNEALMHADAIVVGEAEQIWPKLIEDARNGNLKCIYRGGPVKFSALPWPRKDIINPKYKYLTTKVVMASRGCPRSCTFCSVGFAVGKRYRTRLVGDVVAELKATPGKIVYFADENMGCDIEYTKALLRELIPLKITWYGQIELAALEDQEVVNLVAKSGCASLQIGFDSLSADVIKSVKKEKTNDPAKYRQIVRKLHKAGIVVAASFIVGFDLDNKTVFNEIVDFINDCNIEVPSVNILVPYPGTHIFRQYEREDRLLSKNWDIYDTATSSVVYRPKTMTARELANNYLKISESIYSTRASIKRIFRAQTINITGNMLALYHNIQKKKSVRKEINKTHTK
jgi:radical SAM superfamily enzyme YgiQ (UPF0313 family)